MATKLRKLWVVLAKVRGTDAWFLVTDGAYGMRTSAYARARDIRAPKYYDAKVVPYVQEKC